MDNSEHTYYSVAEFLYFFLFLFFVSRTRTKNARVIICYRYLKNKETYPQSTRSSLMRSHLESTRRCE